MSIDRSHFPLKKTHTSLTPQHCDPIPCADSRGQMDLEPEVSALLIMAAFSFASADMLALKISTRVHLI